MAKKKKAAKKKFERTPKATLALFERALKNALNTPPEEPRKKRKSKKKRSR